MVEERESSQSWNLYLAGSGILSVVLELLLGIVFLEQAFSHSQISFHYATTLFSLLTALIIAPLPWFAGRKGCMSLRREMLDAGAGDDSIWNRRWAQY